MSILNNSVEAIQVGVEDYDVDSPARLKAALRNVHAGVLLLFKCKLQELSPKESDEVLLKQFIRPSIENGRLSFVGKGKKTVDIQAMEERFTALKIHVDWKMLKSATRIRNEVEHYFTTESPKAIREALGKLFVIAVQFAKEHLKVDLRSHLTEEVWNSLVDIRGVYELDRDLCTRSQQNLKSSYALIKSNVGLVYCEECSSDLIEFTQDGGATCRCCGQQWENAEVEIAKHVGALDAYLAVKDGAEESVVDCPDCGETTYIVEESFCVNCESSYSGDCARCGIPIPPSEIDWTGYCSWCNHMMDKDD